MIISHSKRFIFIKTRKTASTSLERFLHPSLGAADIWTPLSDPETAGNHYLRGDRLLALMRPLHRLVESRDPPWMRRYRDHTGIRGLPPRLRALGYFTFCFDRNPWDYLVSLFFHKRAHGEPRDFDDFVRSPPYQPNWHLYTIDGSIAVDAVYRYEEISARLAELSVSLGLVKALLPTDKSQYRPKEGYRQYYTQSTRDEVARRWKPTIDYLGYDF